MTPEPSERAPRASAAPGRRPLARVLTGLGTILLSGVAVVVAWLGVELVFWTFPGLLPADVRRHLGLEAPIHTEDLRLYAPDAVLEHRAIPGVTLHVDHPECPFDVSTVELPGLPQWGWRTPAYRPGVPVEWLVVGDSFAFGYGVPLEQTLVGLLSREGEAKGWQALGLGLSNLTGTLQYELILDRALDTYRPANVLILHYENDYFDNYLFRSWQVLHALTPTPQTAFPQSRRLYGTLLAEPVRVEAPEAVFGPRLLLYRSSVVWNAFKKVTGRPPFDRPPVQPVSYGGVRYVLSFSGGHWTRPDDPRAELGARLGEEAVGRMVDRAASAGARATVFLVPSKEALILAGDPRPDADVAALTYFRRRLARFSRDRGVRVIDPAETWTRLIREQQLYFPVDAHWTPEGHRAALEALAPEPPPGP